MVCLGARRFCVQSDVVNPVGGPDAEESDIGNAGRKRPQNLGLLAARVAEHETEERRIGRPCISRCCAAVAWNT